MKKSIFIFSALAVGALFLAGCAAPSGTDQPAATVSQPTIESTGNVDQDSQTSAAEISSLDATADFPDFDPAEIQE